MHFCHLMYKIHQRLIHQIYSKEISFESMKIYSYNPWCWAKPKLKPKLCQWHHPSDWQEHINIFQNDLIWIILCRPWLSISWHFPLFKKTCLFSFTISKIFTRIYPSYSIDTIAINIVMRYILRNFLWIHQY